MLREKYKTEYLETDFLIIGGGAAGCVAAVELHEKNPDAKIIIMEKAYIDRSGCLAAGMNTINAYIPPDETEENFTRYIRADSIGLVREDLILSSAPYINPIVKKLEKWGLPFKKDKNKKYITRGKWHVKINGERLKPILAAQARKTNALILNRTTATNFLTKDGKVIGATGFNVRHGKFFVITSKATLIATGGASGIYSPNNGGLAHHKVWYSPFNTGAGYAMGIRAGAEMTSFEMRFIALRTKDVIAPTGILSLEFNCPLINARGENFLNTKYHHIGGSRASTNFRLYSQILEVKEGRGPVYYETKHLSDKNIRKLKIAYLNAAPHEVLYLSANNFNHKKDAIEICGTEPYITGGHCQAGYWIDKDRSTTLEGLYAAGDVAGGFPHKFASGCMSEGIISANSALKKIKHNKVIKPSHEQVINEQKRVYAPLERMAKIQDGILPNEMERRLQKIMDEYAGGICVFYEMNEERLLIARKELSNLKQQTNYLIANDFHELMLAHEVIDRIDVARVLVEHLIYRKETRWPGYQTRLDYPWRDDYHWLKFVNSRMENGKTNTFTREYKQIVPGDKYISNYAV